jgi:oligoribonuclease NrnB/cAMP/cGMP phosphodiesterase (DHH superfamily)
MDYVIYHAQCTDGWSAAFIAKMRYPEAKLLPRNHGEPIDIEMFRDKDVLCVDINLRGKNDEVAAIAKSYHIYDHHKSETDIIGKPYVTYDVTRSGAGLAWDYLFGKDFLPSDYYQGRPFWIDYVEDRDLWKFSLPKSEEVNAYIMTFPYEIEAWDRMARSQFLYMVTAGEAILLHINKYVREAVKLAQPGTLNLAGKRYTVGVVNVPYLNTSEVGHALAHRYDIGLGYFERADGMIQFSARSMGDIDVSLVAKAFGGGGHANAAGFQLPLDKGRDLVDNILGR